MNKLQLLEKRTTCLIFRGEEVIYKSCESGITPLVNLLDSGLCVRGCIAVDRIIGKAAALLYLLMGVSFVEAEVVSREALAVLQKAGVCVSCLTLTEKIVNRAGTDVCPMEKAVAKTTDPKMALKAVKEKLAQLKKQV